MSPEVREYLEQGGVAAQRRLTQVSTFKCFVCQLDGNVRNGDDAALVLVRFEGGEVLRMTHPRCMASGIVAGDFDRTEFVDKFVESAGDRPVDVVSAGFVSLDPTGPTAVLLIDRSEGTGILTPGGGFVDLWMRQLEEDGWLPYLGLNEAEPLVSRYRLRLDSDGSGVVDSPYGAPLLDRLPPLPDEWVPTARANGEIVVYAGALRLAELGQGWEFAALAATMNDARLRGEVVLARLPVVASTTPLGPSMGEQLAEVLERTLRTNQPGDGGDLDSVPLVVPFPAAPRLWTVSYGDGSALLLDLNDEDDQRARATLKALRSHGLPLLKPNKGWGMVPRGWAAVLWPTQALIQAPPVDGEPRHVLFARYDDVATGLSWYGQTKRHPSVYFLVANFKGTEPSAAGLTRRIERGRALGGVMPSMAAV